MTPTNDLFLLIKNLSATEKRYFTIWSSKHTIGKKNIYLKLFEDIDYYAAINDAYNEKEFLKKYKTKPYSKNIAYNKNYLFEQIMQAMRAYNKEENDVSQTIFDLLKDIKFYKEKRLLQLWEKGIEKAKDLAILHEKHHLLLLIEKEKHAFDIENQQKNLQQILSNHIEKRNQLIANLTLFEQLDTIQSWFFLLIRMYGQGNVPAAIMAEAEKLINLPLIKDYQLQHSMQNDKMYFRIQHNYFYILKDYEKCSYYQKRIFEVTMTRKTNISSKIIAASNYLSTLLPLKKWEEFSIVLEQIKKLPATTEDEKGELFQNEIFYEQLLLLNTGKLDEACALEKKIRAGIEKYIQKINTARKIAMLMNLGLSYFLNDNFAQAKILLEEISDDRSSARKDIKIHARFLYLITLYETQEYEKLENAIRGIHRSKDAEEYKKSRLYFLVEVLNGLTTNSGNEKNQTKIYEQLSPEKISDIEVRCWLYTKLHKKSTKEAYVTML